MAKKDFTTTITVDQSAEEVFDAIRNVRGWWLGLYGEEFEGASQELNDEFTYRAGEGAHYSKQKLIESVPGKKLVWLVTESTLNFLEDKSEWTNTKLSFDISELGDKTQVRFTHVGLIPEIECFDVCSNVWGVYIQEKLLNYISKENSGQ